MLKELCRCINDIICDSGTVGKSFIRQAKITVFKKIVVSEIFFLLNIGLDVICTKGYVLPIGLLYIKKGPLLRYILKTTQN